MLGSAGSSLWRRDDTELLLFGAASRGDFMQFTLALGRGRRSPGAARTGSRPARHDPPVATGGGRGSRGAPIDTAGIDSSPGSWTRGRRSY